MLNRRLFLQTSTASLTAIASTNPALAKGILKDKKNLIDTVIYDDRHSGSNQFANDAVKQGAKALPIQEDINEVTFNALTEQFKGKSIIAGFTKDHVAGYILGLARDYSYQQVHFTELEPELSIMIAEQSQMSDTDTNNKLVAWVLAPIYI
jgi:hypothetical protein